VKRRFGIRPSPAVSGLAVIAGVGMIAFGIYFLAQTGGHPFIIVWLLVAAGITIYHAVNAFGGKKIHTEVIDYEDVDDPTEPPPPTRPADRLRDLQKLRDDGLITEAEFERKRREILREL